MNPDDTPEYFGSPEHWLSECCEARGLELRFNDKLAMATGLCTKCHNHATFLPEEKPESVSGVYYGRTSLEPGARWVQRSRE